jgi:multisubunit Na+/H+ antiporter MnhG subunit
MLWVYLIVGVLIAAFAVPRIGKVILRLFALLVALVILVPLASVVAIQRARVRRRRRNPAAGNRKSTWSISGSADPAAVPTGRDIRAEG